MNRRHTLPTHSVATHYSLGQFDYPANLVDTAGPVTVYYDALLGSQGLSLAQQLLAQVNAAYNTCQGYFGVPGAPVNVIVAPISGNNDGSGGAYHYGCDFTNGGDLYLDATFAAPQFALLMEVGLFVAELSECFMGLQAKGWDCGGSNGEALSRFQAELASGGDNGALSPFGTGPAWDQAGRPNWIDTSEGTDQGAVSIGCGMVYLYWIMSKGFTPTQITQAAGATLAKNYQALTGLTTAWADFNAACAKLGSINSDNPWGTAPAPAPAPQPVPAPSPAPTPAPVPAPTPAPTPNGYDVQINVAKKLIVIGHAWKHSPHSSGPQIVVHPVLEGVEVPAGWTVVVAD